MQVVQRRRNRQTGTVVLVIDNRDGSFEEPGESWDDPVLARQLKRDVAWATLCDDHGNYCLHPRKELALALAPVPAEWCSDCYELDNPPRDEYERHEAALDYTPARDLDHILDVLIGG